jgi:hypothetical protein
MEDRLSVENESSPFGECCVSRQSILFIRFILFILSPFLRDMLSRLLGYGYGARS